MLTGKLTSCFIENIRNKTSWELEKPAKPKTLFERVRPFYPPRCVSGIPGISIQLQLISLRSRLMAVALSTRFNIVVTLSGCIGIFLLGLISDYVFGRFAEGHIWAKIGRFLVPNLQVFWISDAIYEGSEVTIKYILIGTGYAVCYTTAILAIAVALFQRRQVG